MADCDSPPGCSNISIMQLFHELKQKFPAVPDRVVSECIRQCTTAVEVPCARTPGQGNRKDKVINTRHYIGRYPIALKMSGEPSQHPTTICEPSELPHASRQTSNQPSNFEFLTNVVDNSGSGVSSDRTMSVVTYSSEVNVNYSGRVRSALEVSPQPHYMRNPPPQQTRSYTSVNLTLRPPSSEPQPPIDIRSAGSSLTYSTCSYDPQQGFQSQLQIRIGPGGMGSVSALRTHVPPHAALPPSLLVRQLERRNKLKRELCREKENLLVMQQEVQDMKKDLEQRQRRKQTLSLPVVSSVKVQDLRAEIHRLQEECKKMTQEVDLNMDARVPLGETDEEFYKNIYTGQRGFIVPPTTHPPPPSKCSRCQD
ncbi:hypothetical protein C0J52_07566 [Blattella germanica]|nr:hypothetical protein C0J52_07566 [Blattella germanica]